MRARSGTWLEAALFGLAALLFTGGYAGDALRVPPFEPGPRTEGVLRVVTWNVGGGLAGGSRALREEHLDHVAGVLRELDPDLVFLQELESASQGARLWRRLGQDWRGEVSRGGDRRVAALVRDGTLERFEVAGAGSRKLGIVHRSERFGELAAVVLHAHAFSSEERNAAIGAAARQLAGRPERARLLVGDLNLALDLDKRRDLFTDDEHRDVETYNYVAGRLLDAARGRGTTAEPDRRLDYVFVDPAAFRVRAAGPWKGHRAADMDHDPLVADLELQ